MVMDSMTKEVLAVGVAEEAAEFEERFTKWGGAEDALNLGRGAHREPGYGRIKRQ